MFWRTILRWYITGEEDVEKKTSNDINAVHNYTQDVSAAYPEICETPSPAEPVPIPYPNTASAKDASTGSKTVKMDGKETRIKDSSSYTKSTGDEPPHDSNMETVHTAQLSPTGTIKGILSSRTLGIPLWIWGIIVISSLVIILILTSNALQPIIPYELSWWSPNYSLRIHQCAYNTFVKKKGHQPLYSDQMFLKMNASEK